MPDPHRPLSEGKIAALKLLKQAFDDAEDVGHEKWQFAIRKASLLAAGVTVSDLRWLLSCRLIEEACEVTKPGDGQRRFRNVPDLALNDGDCFVLTYGGRTYLTNRLDGHTSREQANRDRGRRGRKAGRRRNSRSEPAETNSNGNAPPAARARLEWRPVEGEFYFRGALTWRRGRKRAKLEEALLDKFTKATKGCSVPNPFGDSLEARQQLKEAVRRLNDSLLNSTLRFHVHSDCATASWEDCTLQSN